MDALNTWELGLLDWIQAAFGCRLLDVWSQFVSFFGNGGWFFIALGLVLCIPRRTRKLGLTALTALLLDYLLVNLTLKPLVGRIRPYIWNPDARLLVAALSDASFPSGHTAAAFAFAASLREAPRAWRIVAFIFAVCMACSRLYLYVHYPTDVLAGALMGASCGLLAAVLWKTIAAHRKM